jgi:hypothetical protein
VSRSRVSAVRFDAGQDAPRPPALGVPVSCVDATQTHPYKKTPHRITGGEKNVAEGFTDSIGGGFENKAIGVLSWIGGGESNKAKGNSSSILGLDTKEASGEGEVLY